MKLRNMLLMAVSAMSAVTLGSCGTAGGGQYDLGKADTLVVGMECEYAPFNWTETKASETNVAITGVTGSYAEGYDVQVARKLASELNLKLEVKAIAWDGLIPSLTSKQIDCIIAGMSPTAERKETIDFTAGYYTSTHVLLVKKTSTYASATTLAGFSGAKVAGQLGTLYADLVPQVVAKGATAGTDKDTVPLLVNDIITGEIDATILEEPVATGICAQYSELTFVKPTDGFDVAEEDVVVSIGTRKNSPLTAALNTAMSKVLSDSTKKTLMEQAITMAPAE